MGRKKAYGPDYKKPWVRRSSPHQRTQVGDHRDLALLLFFVVVAVAAAVLLWILERAGKSL